MRAEIYYSKEAGKFLTQNTHLITKVDVENQLSKAIKKIIKIEDNNSDIKRLKGILNNCFRLRIGKIRIIFSIEYGEIYIVSVNDINVRGTIYKKK